MAPSILDETVPDGWTPTVPPPAPQPRPRHRCDAMDDLLQTRVDQLTAKGLREFAFDFPRWWKRQLKAAKDQQRDAAQHQAHYANVRAPQLDQGPA